MTCKILNMQKHRGRVWLVIWYNYYEFSCLRSRAAVQARSPSVSCDGGFENLGLDLCTKREPRHEDLCAKGAYCCTRAGLSRLRRPGELKAPPQMFRARLYEHLSTQTCTHMQAMLCD